MKKIVALVTGGFTEEAVISFKSAAFVEPKLDPTKFDVYKITITRASWHYIDADGLKHEIDRNDFSLKLNGKHICFDVVFVCLLSSPGEDGKLQGYFDMLSMPYTSCDALTSAVTMNKAYAKMLVAGTKNLYLANSVQLFSNEKSNVNLIRTKLKLPYFVKANHGGSSIRMSKIKTFDELPNALNEAFYEDSQVLVEEFIKGREFTIGVYKNKNGIQILPATEVISSREVFDFEVKYTPGLAEEITPGRLTEEERTRLNQIAKDLYINLNCKGVVRTDFILEDVTNHFYFLEINTVPGQTTTSFIPQQVAAAGLNIQDFYTELIESALCSVGQIK